MTPLIADSHTRRCRLRWKDSTIWFQMRWGCDKCTLNNGLKALRRDRGFPIRRQETAALPKARSRRIWHLFSKRRPSRPFGVPFSSEIYQSHPKGSGWRFANNPALLFVLRGCQGKNPMAWWDAERRRWQGRYARYFRYSNVFPELPERYGVPIADPCYFGDFYAPWW